MVGRLLNDRYELQEKIGEGGMAVVYRALDHQSGQEIALKVMKARLHGTSQKRFAREFRAVSSMAHPHCVRVFEFGETAEFPYFSMELFRGEPVTTLHGKPLSAILEAVYQAASAIEYMHGRGIIHRDVKPSNLLVRVERAPSDGESAVEVKLMDFGLARFACMPSSLTMDRGFMGTLKYCAPEQINGAMIDFRADLYSFGLVCYEVLSGCYPFEEAAHEDVQSLIRAHMTQSPQPIRRYEPDVPVPVEEGVMALLNKEPSERPSLRELLRDVLGPATGHTGNVADEPTSEVVRVGEWNQPRLVGRERELAVVRRLLHRALSPHVLSAAEWTTHPTPSVLFVTGEPGVGKSRLLQEVIRLARGRGANVYGGRCFEGNLAPYQPFVEILQQILLEARCSEDRRRPEQAEAALVVSQGGDPANAGASVLTGTDSWSDAPRHTGAKVIEDYKAEILRIAPDLRKWLPGEAFHQVDLSRETNYVLRAIASLFIELGTLHGTCLMIEDLQWADQSTLDLLRHLVSGLSRSRELSVESNLSYPRLFVCCTARSGQDRLDRFMEELCLDHQAQLLKLDPFSQDELHALVEALLGGGGKRTITSFVEPLARWCQGNPFFVCEVIRGWLAAGRIVFSDGHWRATTDLDDPSCLPESVRDVLRARVHALSATARQLLGACAVLGTVVEIDVLREACSEIPENEFLDALDELLAAKTMFESGSGLRLEFVHDAIREQIYQELSASRRRALHRRVADVLEKRCTRGLTSPPELLASHFSAAAVRDKAFGYLVDAAQAALSAYAVDDAIDHLTRARELAPESIGDDEKYRLDDLLATAYTAAGRPLEAIPCHRRNLEMATAPVVHASVLRRLGELHFRVGDFDAAIDWFDEALRYLGARRPRSGIGAAVSCVLCFVRHLWPKWPRIARPLQGERRDRVQALREVYDRSAQLWVQQSMIQSAEANLQDLVLAERLGDLAVLAEAYGEHALLCGALSMKWLAVRAGKRAVAYAGRTGDEFVESVAKGLLGSVHYYGARLPEAEKLLQESLAVVDRRGDTWLRQLFWHNLRHVYAVLGDAEKEISSAKVEIQIGEAVRDSEATCWGAYGVANALARSGKLAEAHKYMARALENLSPTNIVVVPTALQTHGFVHLQSGDFEAAREVLQRSRKVLEENWAYVDYSIRVYPLLVESLLGPRWHDPHQRPDGRQIRQAWRICRRGLFWARRFPNYLPHMLRARGRAAFARGKVDKALRYFSEAIAAAERIGARYDLARAYIDRSRIAAAENEEDRIRGEQILAELGAVAPEVER